MTKRSARAQERVPSGKKALEQLDRLFVSVVSVSNKAVHKKMAAEKRKRQAKRKKLAR